ncbi:hypothetical protein B0F90DRAFT_522010 [Multifurca ochricompacta]|uniref:Uncharacterized protein n=1 Tax=Multifurca ochricompacta TaxID=376703 RepID=A0AAD4MBI4_9AGAM|nr:hypothetical protein B0F90DRAFT_522010 [Multifurca ochricompacta]
MSVFCHCVIDQLHSPSVQYTIHDCSFECETTNRIAGLQTDAHLRENQFNIALSVYYALPVAPFIGFTCPSKASNWALKRVGANFWLPCFVFLWGMVTTLSGLVENFGDLVAAGSQAKGASCRACVMYERQRAPTSILLKL